MIFQDALPSLVILGGIGQQVCIVATLPGTGVTADCKVEKSRSRYLGGKIM